MGNLTVDTSNPREVRAGLAFLKVLVDDGGESVESTDSNGAPPDAGAAEKMVSVLWGRTGDKTHGYLKGCARLGKEGPFDLNALGNEVGDGYDVARRWRYGIGRSLKRISQEMPTAPPLFDDEWDGTRQVYTMRPEVAEAILRQDD